MRPLRDQHNAHGEDGGYLKLQFMMDDTGHA